MKQMLEEEVDSRPLGPRGLNKALWGLEMMYKLLKSNDLDSRRCGI